MRLYGGIETGGTKTICGVGDSSGTIINKTAVSTAGPEATMEKIIEFFREIHQKTPLSAFGIVSFGPIDVDLNSPTYGCITTTPKEGWAYFNIVNKIKQVFNLPVGFDTDVNGAAIGEARWGTGKGINNLLYWTVGTGIGAGGVLSGKLMHGLIHPEMGHAYVPYNKTKDPFDGICSYHGNCLEGLASGPAIEKRWNVERATDLPPDHMAWDLEAEYLGYAIANCILMASPQKIIIGGGVMNNKELYPKIRKKVAEFLYGYVKHESVLVNLNEFIVPPELGDYSGVYGAIALAEMQLRLRSEI